MLHFVSCPAVTIAGGPEPPRSRHSQGLTPETKILALLLAEAGLLGVTSASPSYTTVDPAIGAGIQYHLGTIGGVAANVTVDVSVAACHCKLHIIRKTLPLDELFAFQPLIRAGGLANGR
jgi:hypothetical protein